MMTRRKYLDDLSRIKRQTYDMPLDADGTRSRAPRLTPKLAETMVRECWPHVETFLIGLGSDKGPWAEQVVACVWDELADDRWAKVRAWTGQASFLTFLLALVRRLLEDSEGIKRLNLRLIGRRSDVYSQIIERTFPGNPHLQEDARDYLLARLDALDVLHIWRESREPEAYLRRAIRNALVDFKRSKRGHPRPPDSLQEKGPLWQKVWDLLVRHGFSRQQTFDKLIVETGADPPVIERAVADMLAHLPVNPGPRKEASLNEAIENLPAPGLNPSEQLDEQETRCLQAAFLTLIVGEAELALPAEIRTLIERLRPHVRLSDEARLFLRLHYVENLSIPMVKSRLNLSCREPYKYRDKCLRELREACRRAGLFEDDRDAASDNEGPQP